MIARLVPYDAEVLGALAARHHEQLWPAQPIASLVLALVLAHWVRGGRGAPLLLAAALAALWLWSAIGWEWQVHGMLNWAGPWLGALLGLQALLLPVWSARRRAPAFEARGAIRLAPGAVSVIAGLLVLALGGGAGLAFVLPPAPVVVLTTGMLLLARGPVPAWLLVVPLAWTAYALCVAWALDLVPDAALLVLALAGIIVAPWGPRGGDGG